MPVKLTNEELYFEYWVDDLIKNNIVESIERAYPITITERKSLMLKGKEKFLLHPLTYEADYVLKFTGKAFDIGLADYIASRSYYHNNKKALFLSSSKTFIVEVKPDNMFKRKQNTSDISFAIKQKVLYHFMNTFINKIKIPDLFIKTFTPEKYIANQIYQKTTKYGRKGTSKIKFKVRTIGEWLGPYYQESK